MPTAWPDTSDLTALFVDSNITLPSFARMNAAVKWARAEWQRRTRWLPFLAATTSTGTYAASASPVNVLVADSSAFQVGGSAIIDAGSVVETQSVTAIPDSIHVTVAQLTNAHDGSVTPFTVQSQTTRYYTPPGPRPPTSGIQSLNGGGRVLELDCGAASVTSLSVSGVAYTRSDPASNTFQGQYWLEPVNNPAIGRPYDRIHFWAPIWGLPQAVAITAVFGFTAIPDDAWGSILSGAAWRAMGVVSAQRSQGAAQRVQGEQYERYAFGKDTGAYFAEIAIWQNEWKSGIDMYRRMSFGV